MLNLEEALFFLPFYRKQRDFYLKIIVNILVGILSLKVIAAQTPDAGLLQLMPGVYLLILLEAIVFLIFFVDSIFRYPVEIDNKRIFGTKTILRLTSFLIPRMTIAFSISLFFVIGKSVLPVSLDSYKGASEEGTTQLWSLVNILDVETSLVLFILLIAQLPVFLLFSSTKEKDALFLPKIWRAFTFGAVVVSGMATPTIDAYTQLSFAGWILVLYGFTIRFLQKRVLNKYLCFLTNQ